ncbi:Uu.00g084850.m01.CDS01 [Anthostomella pinea]|uniref:Uu.00g084850.m01.CDS01 n=1 Tax=Anthostomella pinea TaxID=933095 RepID=A0AAI8VLU4_9PEZI|nr:Uu.00g084850.m01.CDS01 [Anthostomella pinea]
MAGFLVPDHFEKEEMDEYSIMIASIFLGFTIAFAIFSAATAARQTLQSWRRARRVSIYVSMIWGHWLVNNIMAIISFLYLRDIIQASFWLWFFIIVLWVFQSQLIIQIITNRISLLIMVRRRARKLKWAVFGVMTFINVAVFIIWIPARLEINDTWIDINEVWDRIEKTIFLILDLGLNVYFIYLVRHQLISNGLKKYVPLFRFNIFMVAMSISCDVILIGLMSLPNDLIYLQFQSVAYAVKLHIEMNMADLIKKIVRASNVNTEGLSSGIEAKGKMNEIRRSPTYGNNLDFITDITRGSNYPYAEDITIHIELDSTDDLPCPGRLGAHTSDLEGGVEKTAVPTQSVGRRSVEDEEFSEAGSERGLKDPAEP